MPFVYTISGIDPSLEYKSLQEALRNFCKTLQVPIHLHGLTYNYNTNSKEANIYFGYKEGTDAIVEELFKYPVCVDGKYYKFKITPKKHETCEDPPIFHLNKGHGGDKTFTSFDPSQNQESPTVRNLENNKYARDRSRSPLTDEASALNMELKLLEKQKQIIEEQRRVLLKKKLLDSKPVTKHHEEKYGQPSKKLYHNAADFPKFMEPRKILESSMKEIITRIVPDHHRHLFYNLYRSQLRRDIALAVAFYGDLYDNTFTTDDIIAIYRLKNSSEKDKSFVTKVWGQVKNAYWPLRTIKVNGQHKHVYPDDDELQTGAARTADDDDVAEAAEITQPEDIHYESKYVVKKAEDEDDTIEDNWVEGNTDWN